jgi:hypothetical protein
VLSNASDQKNRHINFGFVMEENDISLPEQSRTSERMTKSMGFKRKSSIRSNGSILDRKSEIIKFLRNDSGFHHRLKI